MILPIAAVLAAVATVAVRRRAPGVLAVAPLAAAIGAAGALVAAVGFDASPTGGELADQLLRAVTVGVLAWCGALAAPGAVLVAAGVGTAALLAASSPLTALAGVALAVPAVLVADRVRAGAAPVATALAASCLALFMLRLDWPERTGAPTLVALAAAVPLVWSGWRHASAGWRKGTFAAGALVVLGALAGAGATAVAAVQARPALEDGVAAARAGLDVLSNTADRDRALATMRQAEARFAEGRAQLDAWWARPGRLVPVVGQHARLAATMAAAGEELAARAGDVLERLDLQALRPSGTRIDLDALGALTTAVAESAAAMAEARAETSALDSPWLVELLTERRDELLAELDDAQARTASLASALEMAQGMLGAEGPRRYLLVVQTLSESRATGGFMGNWGYLTADRGELDLPRVGRIRELDPPQPLAVDAPAEFLERYGFAGLSRTIGRFNLSPDFPTVGRLITDVFPQTGEGPIDGVVALDPVALAAVLRVTGPVSVPSWPEAIGADNVVQVLSFDSYNQLANDDRIDLLGEVATASWLALTSAEADLATVIDAFRPAVAGRHLQVFSALDAEQAELERLGVAGKMPELRGDSFALITQNLSGNKIDWFLERETDYAVDWDPGAGTVRATARITLRNLAPAEGLAPAIIDREDRPDLRGFNTTWVNVYTPLELTGATLNGRDVVVQEQFELGRNVYWVNVSIPPQSAVTLELSLAGTLPLGAGYRLDVVRQPTARPDRMTVRLRPADGWRLTPAQGPLRVDGVGLVAALPGDQGSTVIAMPEPMP